VRPPGTVGQRTGPIGRSVRLLFCIAAAATLASIIDAQGPARFRNPHVLSEPSAWVLHGLAVLIFVILVGSLAAGPGQRVSRRAQAASLVLLGAVVAIAATASFAISGSFWGFPIADLVWIFDVVVLAQEVVAFLLAIALGTPGCEIGVWRELVARARGERAPSTVGLACVVGIHLIDRWEATRRKEHVALT